MLKKLLPTVALAAACAPAAGPSEPKTVRIALFNIRELSTAKLTDVDEEGAGRDEQTKAAAKVIQIVRPAILIINEIDHDYQNPRLDLNARRFVDAYLNRGPDSIDYPYSYAAPCNTGILSGLDLNGDGEVGAEGDLGDRRYGDDSYGFGTYPGQYSMAVLSRYPIQAEQARTFREFLWKDLPGNHIPPDFYSPQALQVFRLSSKSHWDLPVQIEDLTLRLLVSHPTPRGFDGPEDRNGRRNFDEIRFWKLYLDGDQALYDDSGQRGASALRDDPVMVVGDLNSAPNAEDSLYDGQTAVSQLLAHPRLQDPGALCTSQGALQGRPAGAPNYFERNTITYRGGSRIDYLLPDRRLQVDGCGVFWPSEDGDPQGHALAEAASDHRMVWVDLLLP